MTPYCRPAPTALPLLASFIVALATGTAAADPIADFYHGQTITLLVGANTGGGYDTYARPVSHHLGRFIPGEPNIVVKYMPAAGGLPAANTLYSVSSQDGLTIGLMQRHIPFERLRGNKTANYDPFKFNWLASLASEVSVTIVWHTAPHKTAQDLLKIPLIAGSLGQQTDSEIETNAMIHTLNAPIKLVRGYSGTSENLLAVERGEIQGVHGISWSYIKTRKAPWLKDHKIRVLLQTSLDPAPDLKVPSVYDLIKTDEVRQIWDLILKQKVMSRPFAAPPNVPAERVAALRTAFARMVKDKDYLAEMKKLKYEVDFIPGAKMDDIIKQVYAVPASIVAKMKAAISGDGKGGSP